MTRVILGAILLFLIGRALSRLVRGVLEGAGYQRGGGQPSAVGLVRDPICGTFVLPGRALTAGAGRDVKHFCSEQCRQTWQARRG